MRLTSLALFVKKNIMVKTKIKTGYLVLVAFLMVLLFACKREQVKV